MDPITRDPSPWTGNWVAVTQHDQGQDNEQGDNDSMLGASKQGLTRLNRPGSFGTVTCRTVVQARHAGGAGTWLHADKKTQAKTPGGQGMLP